jgi:hypothetical protein
MVQQNNNGFYEFCWEQRVLYLHFHSRSVRTVSLRGLNISFNCFSLYFTLFNLLETREQPLKVVLACK